MNATQPADATFQELAMSPTLTTLRAASTAACAAWRDAMEAYTANPTPATLRAAQDAATAMHDADAAVRLAQPSRSWRPSSGRGRR